MSLGITAAGWAAIGAVGTTAVAAYGANKAGDAQADAARAAQSSSDRQFDISRQDTLDLLKQQREDQAPFREAGKSALQQIMAGLNNPTASLASDGGYQFRQQQGEAAINRAAAATGAGYSGATLKALARFNSGLASDEYGARFNRLASLAGIGQTATNATQSAGTSANGQLNTLGTNYSNATTANLGALGEARASGYVASANALGSGIKGLYNAYQMGPWTTGGGSGSVENVLL